MDQREYNEFAVSITRFFVFKHCIYEKGRSLGKDMISTYTFLVLLGCTLWCLGNLF
jgi:hypothetical protein